MTPNEQTSNTIVIGENALAKLIDAIERAYCTGEFSREEAVAYLDSGVDALLKYTNAEVTIENSHGVQSFRDCEEGSDRTELLGIHGGVFRVNFHDHGGGNQLEEVTT